MDNEKHKSITTLPPESQILVCFCIYGRSSGSPFMSFAFPSLQTVACGKQPPEKERITAAGTAPELHGIPLTEIHSKGKQLIG